MGPIVSSTARRSLPVFPDQRISSGHSGFSKRRHRGRRTRIGGVRSQGTHVPVEKPSFKLEQDRETRARLRDDARALNARRCRHRVGRSSQAPDPQVDA